MTAQQFFWTRVPDFVRITNHSESVSLGGSPHSIALYVVQLVGIIPYPVGGGTLHTVVDEAFPAFASYSGEWFVGALGVPIPVIEVRFEHASGVIPNIGSPLDTWMEVIGTSRTVGISRASAGTSSTGIRVIFRRQDTLEILGSALVGFTLTTS